jgi:hypothetical protein
LSRGQRIGVGLRQMRAGVGDEMLRERWRHAGDGRPAARADGADSDSDGFRTPVGSPTNRVPHECTWTDGPRTPWMPIIHAGTDTPTDQAVASVSDFCSKIQWLYRSHDRLNALLDGAGYLGNMTCNILHSSTHPCARTRTHEAQRTRARNTNAHARSFVLACTHGRTHFSPPAPLCQCTQQATGATPLRRCATGAGMMTERKAARLEPVCADAPEG